MNSLQRAMVTSHVQVDNTHILPLDEQFEKNQPGMFKCLKFLQISINENKIYFYLKSALYCLIDSAEIVGFCL